MKTTAIFFVIFLFAGIHSFGQEPEKPVKDINFRIDYDQQAQYPEGEKALYSHINENITFDETAKEKMVSGQVLVSFDVLPDSTLTNIVVLSSPGHGIDQEIIRLLTPLKFIPASANGFLIKQNVMMNIPVRAGMTKE
jgi:TonB family protein